MSVVSLDMYLRIFFYDVNFVVIDNILWKKLMSKYNVGDYLET